MKSETVCPTNPDIECPYRVRLEKLYTEDQPIYIHQNVGMDSMWEDADPFDPAYDSIKLQDQQFAHSEYAKVFGCEGPVDEVCPIAERMSESKPRRGLKRLLSVVGIVK